ncbi:uncharacterized protein THITE_2109082 [Thermothielavioides terrestris NRRL 8126]|uniref:Uncharacterized protein n=1 Tax=Thermothielavioides terrestris (strain ATCC 38088 / NRRL 8126) TaxID=578455 RepID=G2QTI1_THETT|nr:uncharacterized protein THITE_2109082 [Thermothielavioides terrestris NRRL 8126]AEO63598.1 hypothetical protein THITE_2109082 [Thermothielavioides terrestris NRRL 8126]
MVPPPSQPPARTGMSLYANLLETDSSASISRDPVLFKDEATAKKTIDPGMVATAESTVFWIYNRD